MKRVKRLFWVLDFEQYHKDLGSPWQRPVEFYCYLRTIETQEIGLFYRFFLHLFCILRGGSLKWHLAGISRVLDDIPEAVKVVVFFAVLLAIYFVGAAWHYVLHN